MNFRHSLSCLAVISLVIVPLSSQTERGTIEGTVRDTTGAVIPGAHVTITNTATNVTNNFESNASGDFTVPSLQPGNYNIRTEKDGFRVAVLENLTLDAATSARADVTLEIGSSAQTIEVMANAVQLRTEDARSSVTVENKLVNDLPLVVAGAVRSPFDLAALTPESKNFGDGAFALGGGPASAFGASLDGVSVATSRALQTTWIVTNAPSVEALDEFTVDTNGFKAEYGRAAGGQMTFVSKSGTNGYHGDAYEFLRNYDMDANSFFNNKLGRGRSVLKQNDFGTTFGGPVRIPWLYNGMNKTFFFFSYEGFRNRAGTQAANNSVPTPEMYNGDFSKWVDKSGNMIPIYDPTSQTTDAQGNVHRTPFPGNQIPMSLFDPLSVQLIKAYQSAPGGIGLLKPNIMGTPGSVAYVQNNYAVTDGSYVSPVNKLSVRGDHIFGSKDRISGFYGYNRQSQTVGADGPPTLPGLYTNANNYNDLQSSDVFRGSWDHTFSPTIINHFFGGGNNWAQSNNGRQYLQGNWKNTFCLPNVPDCNQDLATVGFSEFTGWGAPANNGSQNPVFAFNDDLTMVRGKHTIKFGGMYQKTDYNGFGRQCVSGCLNFSYQETGVPNGSNPLQGGNSFASFLLGYADSGSLDTVRYIGQQFTYWAGYVQDDWRITPKLVLNLGLRWETTLPPVEEQNRWSDFSPTTPNPAAGGILGALIYAGTGPGRQGSRALADSYFGAFGPHVGFAYSYNSKTVIRGSYARSFGPIQVVSGSTHQLGFTDTQTFGNSNNGLTPTFKVSQGLPPWNAPPFINPSFANGNDIPWWQGQEATRPSEVNSFNLSIQRQLSSSLILEATYNGVLGSHLQTNLLNYDQVNPIYLQKYGYALLNQPYNSPAAIAAGIVAPYPGFGAQWGSRATVARALRPYPQFNSINTYAGEGDHSGHSTYHAAVVRLEKRYSGGLVFQGSYAFSKLLTDADSFWGNVTSGTNSAGVGDPEYSSADHYNRGLEKSIGEYDVTHIFKFGGSYELPLGKGKRFLNHGIGAFLIGGWRLGGIGIYESGTPVGVTSSFTLPLFNGRDPAYITSYNGWRASYNGSFDPSIDNFFAPYGTGPFPLQGRDSSGNLIPGYNSFGNATRYNPKVRYPWNLNENASLAKTFVIHERIQFELRGEAFNLLNRVRFGTGSTQLQSTSFGVLTSSDLLNTPRQLQVAGKLYF